MKATTHPGRLDATPYGYTVTFGKVFSKQRSGRRSIVVQHGVAVTAAGFKDKGNRAAYLAAERAVRVKAYRKQLEQTGKIQFFQGAKP